MNDILTQVLNFAFNHGIGIELVPLKPWTAPKSDSDSRVIILNSNWHQPRELAFQAAHEIGHLLNGDQGVLYYATEPARQAAEGAANRTALSIIVPMYFAGKDPDEANVHEFMENMAIPCWLEDDAKDAIQTYFGNAVETK